MSPILGIYASQISGHLFAPSGAYDSIATTTVGAGGAASVTFSSIPSTYTHLQLRGITRCSEASQNQIGLYGTFNSDTASNYSFHGLEGTGAAAAAFAATSQTGARFGQSLGNNHTSGIFGAFVVDILDYANTNKYKTIKSLAGDDTNNTGAEVGVIQFISGNWRSTSAITSINLTASTGFTQYSQFALYGIKGN